MKIRVIDRILLFLLALVMLVIGVCAALNEFGISVLALLPADITAMLTGTASVIARVAAIVVMIVLSLYLFSVSFRHKKKPDPFINMESGSKGQIRMSMESISSLVLRTCGQIPGVSGMKVSTINHEDSVSVDLSFQVEMEKNIPELSAQIQQTVGEVVERNCGVAVRNVCVTVSGFTVPAPQTNALPESKPAKKQEKKRGGLFHREKKEEIPAAAPEATGETADEEPEAEKVEIALEPETVSNPVIVEEPAAGEPVEETAEELVVEEAVSAQSAEPAAEADGEAEEQKDGEEYSLLENE